MNPIENAIWTIGYNVPIIAFFLAIWKLWYLRPEFYWFIVGFAGNEMANVYLKMWIKEPRPKDPVKFIDHNHLKGAHEYGMPSGHAQIVSFAVTFLILTKRPLWLILPSLFIFSLTLIQRWKYRRHTVEQLIVGSCIGSIFSYSCFYLTESYLHRITRNIKIF
jgi:membrane-associated phospholipid phosphatase